MSKLFDDLKEALEEIMAYKKGKIELRTTSIEVPDPSAKNKRKKSKKSEKTITHTAQDVRDRLS